MTISCAVALVETPSLCADGEIKEAPDPPRLAIYDKLYAKILAGLKE